LLPDAVAEKLTADSVKATEEGFLVWKSDPALTVPGGAGGGSGRKAEMWSFYAKVKTPLFIVRGAQSDSLTQETVNKMISMKPGTRAIEVPGVGHTPWLNEPTALPVLLDFLR
jgi:pimeloyl-ACP methyl ester carboxylesterase